MKILNPVAATYKNRNKSELQHVLSIFNVHEKPFRHYSEGELQYSLQELLKDITIQAATNSELTIEHATRSPQNASPNRKQRLPQKTSSGKRKVQLMTIVKPSVTTTHSKDKRHTMVLIVRMRA